MLPALIVFLYLAVVLYVGVFAFRKSNRSKEDFFLANRGLGTTVFLLSLFGSNMTAFAILGSSGLAFKQGIGVYGLMASISGIIIPLSIFFIGTRLWAIGKRLGHITQVQILRDRFEMGHIGTLVFILQAVMLVPYIIIGVMGGGETLEGVSNGFVPYWLGGLVVALVVMSYVFFGGMRGTAWVNALQTTMFLIVGTIAFFLISRNMGGIDKTVAAMADSYDKASAVAATRPATISGGQPSPLNTPRLTDGALLTRDRVPFWAYLSYVFIPLSSIMFPHIAIFCLTAKKLASFKKTVILYPLCIMAVWLPAVFLGAVSGGRADVVASLAAKSHEAQQMLATRGGLNDPGLSGSAPGVADSERQPVLTFSATQPGVVIDVRYKFPLLDVLSRSKHPAAAGLVNDITAGKLTPDTLGPRLVAVKDPAVTREVRRLANGNSDGVMLELLTLFTPAVLAGILGAAVMACVMASDSQILALSTMFSEDIFAWYGHKARFGERAQVWSARAFVVLLTVVAYAIAIAVHQYENIFDIAIQYAFSGFASMAPIMLGALFWRRATKWGVLASTLWVAGTLAAMGALQAQTEGVGAKLAPGTAAAVWKVGEWVVLMREPAGVRFTALRFLPVLPMFVGSAVLMWLVSLATKPPGEATLRKYFPAKG